MHLEPDWGRKTGRGAARQHRLSDDQVRELRAKAKPYNADLYAYRFGICRAYVLQVARCAVRRDVK